MRHAARAFWIIALVTLALDQLTKALVRASFAPGETWPLIKGLVHLTYVRNMGAAFGLFPGKQPVFIVVSVVVLFVIAAYWRRSRPKAWPIVVALALITSGAAGNLIDRAWLGGRVTDFLELAFVDFPIFNIADSAIVIGVGILIGWLLLVPEPERPLPASTSESEVAEQPITHAEEPVE